MAKYYINCGSLQYIYSTHKNAIDACCDVLEQMNDHDRLDEYFYVDERGFRDYVSAQPDTIVIETETILDLSGYTNEE